MLPSGYAVSLVAKVRDRARLSAALRSRGLPMRVPRRHDAKALAAVDVFLGALSRDSRPMLMLWGEREPEPGQRPTIPGRTRKWTVVVPVSVEMNSVVSTGQRTPASCSVA
jgi:hypothetical protein